MNDVYVHCMEYILSTYYLDMIKQHFKIFFNENDDEVKDLIYIQTEENHTYSKNNILIHSTLHTTQWARKFKNVQAKRTREIK